MQEKYSINQIESFCSFIDEIVIKAEWVIEKSLFHNTENPLELAALLSIRQMTDFADGVSILIKQQSNDSAVPIIRALFEVSAGLEYLIQNDFETRSKKLLFFYYKSKEKDLLKRKKGTSENLKLVKELEGDKNVSIETIQFVKNGEDVENQLNAVQKTLNQEIYSELKFSFDSTKFNKRKYWYSLLDGPETFKKLLESIGMPSRYEVSYSFWSAQSHGLDIINRNLVFENGNARIIAKRNPAGSYDNTIEVVTILRRCLMNYVQKRLMQEITPFSIWLVDYSNRLENTLFKN